MLLGPSDGIFVAARQHPFIIHRVDLTFQLSTSGPRTPINSAAEYGARKTSSALTCIVMRLVFMLMR